MSFLLDPFLSVLLGAIFFSLSKYFGWKTKVTVSVTGVAAVLATFYSVILYLDWLSSDILILDTLYPIIRTLPQKGSEIMLHSNVTGIRKADFPVFLAAFFYALYPLWVYLGYRIMANITSPREPTPSGRLDTVTMRTVGIFLYLGGALLMLYGLVMPTEYGSQAGFVVANVAIWILIIGTYLITTPKSERDLWWSYPKL